MKILGKRSLASIIKSTIDLVYYLAVLAAGLFSLVTLWLLFCSTKPVSVQVPVQFQLDPPQYQVSSSQHSIEAVELRQARGTLNIVGLSRIHLLFQAGIGMLALMVSLLVLNRLRAIFNSLKEQNPFIAVNASRIRFIGFVVIAGELLSKSLLAWSSASVAEELSVSGLKLRTDLDLDASILFLGLVLIIISEMVRLGSQMKADLETAREIQFDLVPAEAFERAQIDIHSYMRPANTVGGDYYDLIDLGQNQVGVVLGDVSGKGLPAAMLMASLQGSLRTLISAGFRGKELIGKLNTYLCENTPENRLVTLFYGELDLATGAFRYVNSGHNAPFWLRGPREICSLESTCVALGIVESPVIHERNIQLQPEDQILLFTDGLSEAFNKQMEAFGEDRLRRSLLRHQNLSPPELIQMILSDILAFTGPAKQSDDLTVMVVRRKPSPGNRLPA